MIKTLSVICNSVQLKIQGRYCWYCVGCCDLYNLYTITQKAPPITWTQTSLEIPGFKQTDCINYIRFICNLNLINKPSKDMRNNKLLTINIYISSNNILQVTMHSCPCCHGNLILLRS